jgi:hypothetical protein
MLARPAGLGMKDLNNIVTVPVTNADRYTPVLLNNTESNFDQI